MGARRREKEKKKKRWERVDGEGHFPLLCTVVEASLIVYVSFEHSFLEWWLEGSEEEYTYIN